MRAIPFLVLAPASAGCADVLGDRSVNGMVDKEGKTPAAPAPPVETAAHAGKRARNRRADTPAHRAGWRV